ncbi:MAG TPA: molybdopterin-binding protein [Polyangiaceae bacterium]|nr:molybdopterin-binding protein [Polyangiaceae bacterium]
MSQADHPRPRVLVAAVMQVKSRAVEALAKAVVDTVDRAAVTLVRSVVVKGERQYIRQLVSNVANDNEADAIILVGGAGIGPRDDTCEAIDGFVERRIEGFGEAYRRLLEVELGAHAFLSRATAGVHNQCLVFAMTGRVVEVSRAMEALVLPTLSEAVELATGRRKAVDPR